MHRLYLLLILLIVFTSKSQCQPCKAPECTQLDFWVGDWDLTWNDTSKGSNSVKKILNDCVINENFTDPAMHYLGMSWSMYDTTIKQWKQTWVDNQNGYITLTGKFSNGEMILATLPGKNQIVSRMVFYNIKPDSFDWRLEAARDNASWKVNWKIHYQRRKQTS